MWLLFCGMHTYIRRRATRSIPYHKSQYGNMGPQKHPPPPKKNNELFYRYHNTSIESTTEHVYLKKKRLAYGIHILCAQLLYLIPCPQES